jgi:hypothetical protein
MSVTDWRGRGKTFGSGITIKISTNFNSVKKSVKRANQAIFNMYRNDLYDRGDTYDICVTALEALCVDGRPKGRTCQDYYID